MLLYNSQVDVVILHGPYDIFLFNSNSCSCWFTMISYRGATFFAGETCIDAVICFFFRQRCLHKHPTAKNTSELAANVVIDEATAIFPSPHCPRKQCHVK